MSIKIFPWKVYARVNGSKKLKNELKCHGQGRRLVYGNQVLLQCKTDIEGAVKAVDDILVKRCEQKVENYIVRAEDFNDSPFVVKFFNSELEKIKPAEANKWCSVYHLWDAHYFFVFCEENQTEIGSGRIRLQEIGSVAFFRNTVFYRQTVDFNRLEEELSRIVPAWQLSFFLSLKDELKKRLKA